MWCQVSGDEVIRVIPNPTPLTINEIQSLHFGKKVNSRLLG